MAALTIPQVVEATRQLVGDLQVDTFHFSDAQLVDAIDWACTEFLRKTGASFTWAALTEDTGIYPLPADQISVVKILADGFILDRSTQRVEDVMNPAWRDNATAEKALRWCYIDGNSISIIPPVTAAEVSAGYIRMAASIETVDGDAWEPLVSDYAKTILHFAAGSYLLKMNTDQQDLQKADKYLSDFNMFVGAGKALRAELEVEI